MQDIVKDSYTLMLGDCLERMREIPDGSVDMVLADLPYGTTACKWDVILPFDVLWEHYWRVLKPDGMAVLFCNQPFTTTLIQSALKQYKYSWIWHKRFAGNFTLAKKQPLRVTEEIAVFGRGGVSYAPQMTQREQPIKMGKNTAKSGSANLAAAKVEYDGKVYDQKYPENILYFSNREEKQRFHPTQNPCLCSNI